MEFILGNSIVNSYKRLAYTPWYALAEFVDNSTQAYFNNRVVLDEIFQRNGESLSVNIEYDSESKTIRIIDNSIGMDAAEIQSALTVGKAPIVSNGRSKYGLGLKTAACWFGDRWRITTSKLGEPLSHVVEVDVNKIILNSGLNSTEVLYEPIPCEESEHYTIIEIFQLNREIRGRTLKKISEHLKSIYRFDFTEYNLKLCWQHQQLKWEGFDSKLYITKDGTPFRINFSFSLSNDKKVVGWVGVLDKGARKNAGFSIVKANRVIQGWPNSFKPSSIFGDDEDGRNDLVNQRLVGELFMDEFEVSHTKDSIVWSDNEEEDLDSMLLSHCQPAIDAAKNLRFKVKDEISVYKLFREAVSTLEPELKSREIIDYIVTVQPPDEEVIEYSFSRWRSSTIDSNEPEMDVEIGRGSNLIRVRVYFVSNSEFEPYVLVEATISENLVTIIINSKHPFIEAMVHTETMESFIRQCIYDGVAEWKASKLIGQIQPYTVKNLKDGLLRIPFVIKQNQFRS